MMGSRWSLNRFNSSFSYSRFRDFFIGLKRYLGFGLYRKAELFNGGATLEVQTGIPSSFVGKELDGWISKTCSFKMTILFRVTGPLPAARHGLRAAYISGVRQWKLSIHKASQFKVDIFTSLICVSKSSTRQVDLVLGATCNWWQTWHFWGWRGDLSSLIWRIKGSTNLVVYL